MLATGGTSAELLLPPGEDCVVQVKATSDGGDGAGSEQVRIPGLTGESASVRPPLPVKSCRRRVRLEAATLP